MRRLTSHTHTLARFDTLFIKNYYRYCYYYSSLPSSLSAIFGSLSVPVSGKKWKAQQRTPPTFSINTPPFTSVTSPSCFRGRRRFPNETLALHIPQFSGFNLAAKLVAECYSRRPEASEEKGRLIDGSPGRWKTEALFLMYLFIFIFSFIAQV